MDNLRTLTGAVLGEVGERRQKRRFNLLLALFFAILAMTAIIAAPIVQSFVSKKVAAVAEWTDGLTPQAFGTETWAGTGTETDAFKIATATDLAQLACNVNAGTTYEGMYFTLTSELNLAGREWTPIGTIAHPFMGTFDGAQKAIYFMTMTGDKYDYYGLFGVVKESLITKVDMRNSYVNVGGLATGGIVGRAVNTSIEYSTNGSEDIEKIGFPTSELADVSMNSISSLNTWFTQAQKRGYMLSGYGGRYSKKTNQDVAVEKISHAETSVIKGYGDVGGMCGQTERTGGAGDHIRNCWVTSEVWTTHTSGDAGGIVGWCTISGSKATFEIYQCAVVSEIRCFVSGSTGAAGGIVGCMKVDGSNSQNRIGECYFRGNAYGAKYNGAVVGRTEGGTNVYIGTTNTGDFYIYYYGWKNIEAIGDNSALGASHCRTIEGSGLALDGDKSGFDIYTWGDGNWIKYSKKVDEENDNGKTVRTTYQLYISPNGATRWTINDKSTQYQNYEYSSVTLYQVTFDKNGGSGGTSSTMVEEGKSIGSINKPTKSGYTFKGYYDSSSGGTQYVNSSGTGTNAIKKAITLYAQWTAQKYKITLSASDASNYSSSWSGASRWTTSSSTKIAYQEIAYGSTFGAMPTPTRSGYTFSGWYYGSTKYTSSSTMKFTSATTLTAKWSKVTISTADIRIHIDGMILGYSEVEAATIGVTTWKEVVDMIKATQKKYSKYGQLTPPTGFVETGWYDGYIERTYNNRTYTIGYGNKKDDDDSVITSGDVNSDGEIDIYMGFQQGKYTISFDNQGATSGGLSSVSMTYNSTFPDRTNYTPPQKDYYTFMGYYSGENGTGTKYYDASLSSTSNKWTQTSGGTLYAYFVAANVTINYSLNNGALPSGVASSQTVAYGSSVTLPTPTKSGYNFGGWYKTSSLSGAISASTTMNSTNFSINYVSNTNSYNTTIYAKWTEKNPTITLSATDASGYSSSWTTKGDWTTSSSSKTATKKYTYNAQFGTMPTPSRTGYTFKGWYDSISGGTRYDSTSRVAFDSNTTLYAQWTAIGYNLSIDPFGGTYTDSNGTKYTSTTTVSGSVGKQVTLGAISRTGYTFGGWKVTAGSGSVTQSSGNWIYTFGAGNGTVTATWTANNYTLTFNKNDSAATWGNIPSGVTASGSNYVKTVTYDKEIGDLPTVNKTGYTFKGWFESSSGNSKWTESTTYTIVGNKTLYAQFTANPYTLTIEYGNSKGTGSADGAVGETYPLPSDLTKTGYTFNGWKKTSGLGTLSGYTFTFGAGNATVEAQWTPNTYKVNYYSNGGTGSMSSSTFTYDVHGTLSANTFTRTGWQFIRWNTQSNDSGTAYIDKADVYNWTSTNGGTINLYAQWGPITYNITFDANGGIIQSATGFSGATGGKFSIASYNYEQALSVLPNVKLTGYTFGGWYYEDTFKTQVKTTDKATKNCTVYAKLTANTYKLRLDARDGTLPSVSGWTISSDKHTADKTVTFDSAIGTMPEPTLLGHTFKGWFDGTGASATQYVASSAYVFDDSKVFYAHYDTDNMTVFFDAAGGSVAASQRVVAYNNSIGALPTPTRAGYNFSAWYYEGTTTKASSSDKVTKTITLVAQWSAKSFTLTFNSNGGNFSTSGSTYSKTVTYDAAIGDFPTVTKTGATLVGWFENQNGTGTQYLSTSIVQFTASTTIYAHFEMDKYTVIFNSNGGTCSITSKVYDYNSTYGTLPTASKVGFKFLGWTKEATGTSYVKSTGKVIDSHTLHAQYQANTYYIDFHKNRSDASGSTMSRLTVKYGEGIKLTKNTYSTASAEFVGWNTDTYGRGDAFSDEQTVYNLTDGDGNVVTLYAQWADNTYWVVIDTLNTVVGNQNGYSQYGSFALRKVFNHNDKISGFPTLTKRGYNIVGYKDEDGNTVTENTQVTSDMRLIPQWEAKTITYTFDANGGTFTAINSGNKTGSVVVIQGKFGEQLGALPTVERTGYTFRSYVERGNENYTIFDGVTITVDNNIYAIAKWDAISYVVVFNAGEGKIDSDNNFVGGKSTVNKYVQYDGTYGALPTATLRGNTFKGWWTEPNMGGTKIETTTVFKNTATTTLYAGWETSKYTVTISANGGNFGSNTDVTRKITGDYGKSYDLPIPSRVGYTFNGYEKTSTTDDGVASDSAGKWVFTFGLGDATLSAKWTPNSYKITFNYVESDVEIVSGTRETERTVVYDSTYGAFPVLRKDGKTFAGWARDNGTTVNGTDTVKITSNITLYAQWTTDEYSLTINPNGGTYKNSTQNTTVRGKLNATTEVVAPTRTGYTFLGWTEAFVGKDGTTNYTGLSGTTYTFGTGNGSLTAEWEAITYEIKFVGGASDVVGQMDNQTIAYGMSVALTKNKFTRAGYEFRSWLRADTTTEYSDTEMVRDLVETAGQVLTFTAQWDVKTYVLTVDPNGGTYAGSSAGTKITREFGKTFDISVAELPTRRGYKFTGFSTNANLSGNSTSGYTYTFTASDDTIVAEWEVCVIYVTLVIPKGATWKDSETKLKFGVTGGDNNGRIQATFGQTYKLIPVEGDIIYAGYVFKGFYTENNQYIEASSLVDFEDDIVLTARYTEHTYTLTIDPNMGEFRNSTSSQMFDGIIGDVFPLEDPTRKGYTFNGWEQSGRGTLNGSEFTFADDNCKLTAKWTANNYTVKFDKNADGVDGTMADLPCTYDVGGRLPENKFIKTGYDFMGWALKQSGSIDVYADGASISNLTDENNGVVVLYAQWKVINYTITFNPNGGTIASPYINRDYGAEYGQFPDATKEGYTRVGWFTELNGGSVVKSDDIVKGAITLYAHWTANTYTITFRAGEGRITAGEDGYTGATDVSETTITVTFGEFYTGMPSAEHVSKLFVGWFVSEQADSSQILKTTSVTVAHDQIFYAHWVSDQYIVSFDANGGTVGELSRTVNHGEPYGTLPEPTYVGYTFDGWFYEDTDERITATTAVTHKGDHTLRAHWTALKFTVSFDYDGGVYVANEGYEGDGTSKVVTYDETFGVLPMAAKTGMRFLGWYDADDKLIDESKLVKILENITVKAKYENIYYSLVIELNGGKYGDLEQVQSFTGIYGQTIEILAPTKTGYNFAKYENRLGIGSVEKDGDIYRFTFGADNSTLYAIWDAMDIRVTFHAQQGELLGTSISISNDKKTGTREYKFGDKFNVGGEMPSARLDGYRFLGWFTELEGGFQMTDEMEITISTNFDLYAQFEPIFYILTIDPQGGVFEGSQHTYDFENKKRGDEVTFNTPTREGYRFLRFIMSGEGTLTAQDEQLSSYKFVFGAGNATLTAVWEAQSYVVTFDYNGADGGDITATLEVTYDQIYDALPVPTKSGYDFAGWFTSAGDDGMRIDNTTTVKTAHDHTLYAHWELHKYKLQVILSGGSINGTATTDVEFEAYFNETVNFSIPTRYGYLFKEFEKVGEKGTLDIREGEGKVYFTFGDDNCKLVAIWENKEITVNFDYDFATSGNEVKSKTVKFDEQYGELPTPAKAGYKFVGWFDSRVSENRVQIISSVLVKNADTHTLFAVFEEITTSLTIVLNGGDLELTENPINKKFGETFTFGEPIKTGYDFIGYTSTVDGALKNNGDGTWTYTFGLTNAVVTAEWAAQSVDVTFRLSSDAIADGVKIDWTGLTHSDNTMKVTFGGKYGTLPKVSRYGWEFKGWFTEENGQGERIIDTSTVTNPESHTLYAHFEQYEYTLKIDLNGGTAGEQQLTIVGHANDTITVIAPTKTGYTFSGFTITSGDITQSGGATPAEQLTFTFKESDATIFANYTANTYTLTFNANGTAENAATIPTSPTGEWIVGADSISATKTVTFGERIGAMPTPKRKGYTFIGWTIGGTEGEDGYTAITRFELAQDLTLNATWAADKYALTIELDGGKFAGDDRSVITITGQDGEIYEITSAPTKIGYKFLGFGCETEIGGGGELEKLGDNLWRFTFGTGNATVAALWEPIEIVITLDANGAQFDESSLNGWTLAEDKQTATKTFNYKDLLGKIENSDGTTSLVALPQVSLEGSKFTGWFVDGTQYSETSPIEWLVDTTLTASFAMNNYLLVINTNGGTYSDSEYSDKVGVFNISKEYGTTYTVASPSKTGYKFTGWSGSGVGEFDKASGAFTFGAGTYTLVAEYEPIKYTIKFDANGGTGTMTVQEFTYDKSTVLNDNAFTRDGFTFGNWNTAADGTGKTFANMGMVLNETDVDGDEITLYAIWDSAWITMYFDANNGTAEPVGIDVQYGEQFGALPSVERKGYNFGGWYESIINDVPQGQPIETTTICKYTESRTFVAFWTIASYEITLPSGYPQDSMTLNVLDAYKGALSADGSKATIVYNHDFAFEITVLEAYSQSNIRVYATSKTTQVKKEILPINGAYMLTQIADDMIISVENLNKNTYNIVFDAREGMFGNSQYTTVTVEWGGKITRPTRPTRLHYDFIGWFASIDSLAEFNFETYKVYADLTLYAKYEKANYKITFYVDDEVFWTSSVQYESRVTKPNDPIKEGYNFVGWRLANGTLYSFSSQVMGELSLYAEFAKNTYTVKFFNGEKELNKVEIKYGETVRVNFGTGIDGYDLEGWYADAAFTTLFDFDQLITSDTNIYGKYVLQQFRVDFYVNGELQATQQVGYKHWATIPTGIIVEVGHHIANWYTDVDLTQLYDFGKSITSDLVLFGKIERDDIVITFVANEQKILRYVKYGDSLDPSEIPAIPARIGYDKVAPYWEDADLTNITSPITINAVYTINKYTITIIMPDGSRVYREVEYGKTLTDLPKISTKFGDKIVYDQDLSNITGNLVVHVEVKNYIFWPLIIAGGILALLVIVFLTIMIVKASKKRSSRDKIKELIDTKGR